MSKFLKNLTASNDDDDNTSQIPLTRNQMWMSIFGALTIVYLLWNIDALDFIVYPLRLFVTFVHEAGHSGMALLTGGKVIGFSVSGDGSGLATTAGGSRALILPAGYLGAAFFGAILFYTVNSFRRPRTIAIIIGVILLFFTVSFASVSPSGEYFAMVVGVGMGLLLLGMGWKLNRSVNLLILNVLAIMTSLNAVLDLVSLVDHADICTRDVCNDAAAFSEEVAGLPAEVWAFIWAGIAVMMVGVAVYYSLLRPSLNNATKALEDNNA